MNAEQIKTLIDTANNLSEIASAMAAKCAKLEKETVDLRKKNEKLLSGTRVARQIAHSMACNIEEIVFNIDDHAKLATKKELLSILNSMFFQSVKVSTDLHKCDEASWKKLMGERK